MTICAWLNKLTIWIAITGFSFASLTYLTSIVLRIFFKTSIPWIDHLTGYLFAVSPILGAAIAVRTDENIKIELLKKFSEKPLFSLITKTFSLVVSLFFIHFFYQHFSIEFKNDTIAFSFFRQWMLDIPYILFFVCSSFFYLEGILKVLTRRS